MSQNEAYALAADLGRSGLYRELEISEGNDGKWRVIGRDVWSGVPYVWPQPGEPRSLEAWVGELET